VAERVVLHIGAPKCGSTHLQTLLWGNKEALGEAGVLVPGTRAFDHNRVAQAARRKEPDPKAVAATERIREEIAAWPGTAVVSSEWFCMAGPRQAGALMSSLEGTVHVVAVARDLARAVPSAWQEALKLGLSSTFADFVEGLDAKGGRWTWATLDPAVFLPRWTRHLPGDRIHLVPLENHATDRTLLWRRFAQVLGIDPAVADQSASHANESLSAEGAALLSHLGPRLREAIDVDNHAWNHPYTWIRDLLSHEVLVPLGGAPLTVDPDAARMLARRAEESVRTMAAWDIDVMGDLQGLTGARPREGAATVDEIPAERLLAFTEQAVVGLLGSARDRVETLQAEVDRLRKAAPGG
jgi:hypothetical protein